MNSKTNSKTETDEIVEKLNREADQAEAGEQHAQTVEGEVISAQAETVEQARYQKALEQGAAIMGWIVGGVGFVWPYVQIDDKELLATGAQRHADVLMKYNLESVGADAMPQWLKDYMPEIKLAMLYGMTGFAIWMQVQAYKAMEAEAKKQKEEAAKNGNKSEPVTA